MAKRAVSGLAVVVLLLATGVAAQQDFFRGFGRRVAPRFPTADSFDGAFNFCRGMFYSDRREPGGQGWWTDYPDADLNFSIRFSELTKARVSFMPGGEPNHLVVRLTDDALFQCPFLLMEDVGTARFSDEEVNRLREYLLKGGFIWVDDFWGEWAWAQWVEEIHRVLPPEDYPIQAVPADHPVYRTFFQITKLPQIPSIAFWRRSGGATSERGSESAVPQMYSISDRLGRMMVVMTHNTDIADAWEREGEDPRFFYQFSPDGYAVGLNVVLYAMTH
ncbi:DUF4159 domain-containing protein [soil metagenome]